MITYNNVKTYNLTNEFLWQITLNNIEDHPEKEIQPYFIMSRNDASNAFFHWVFDDCIYIEEYYKLKKEIPNLKIHIGNNRNFKRIFLKYLKVQPEDIICNLEPINTCYFSDTLHMRQSKIFNNDITKSHMKDRVDRFINYFGPEKIEDIQKTIPILLLPRQNKENYIGNNTEFFTEHIEQIILSTDNRNKILNTDTITDLNDQINMIRNAYIIIVTNGSASIINSMFAHNSHIIILGDNIAKNNYNKNPEHLATDYIIDKSTSNNLSMVSFPTYPGSYPQQININDLIEHINKLLILVTINRGHPDLYSTPPASK
jgi:hypothetical protein